MELQSSESCIIDCASGSSLVHDNPSEIDENPPAVANTSELNSNSTHAKLCSSEPWLSSDDDFTKLKPKTNTEDIVKTEASTSKEQLIDSIEGEDVFGSCPTWLDIPEEDLDISMTPFSKENNTSDFSFDIDEILGVNINPLPPKPSDEVKQSNESGEAEQVAITPPPSPPSLSPSSKEVVPTTPIVDNDESSSFKQGSVDRKRHGTYTKETDPSDGKETTPYSLQTSSCPDLVPSDNPMAPVESLDLSSPAPDDQSVEQGKETVPSVKKTVLTCPPTEDISPVHVSINDVSVISSSSESCLNASSDCSSTSQTRTLSGGTLGKQNLSGVGKIAKPTRSLKLPKQQSSLLPSKPAGPGGSKLARPTQQLKPPASSSKIQNPIRKPATTNTATGMVNKSAIPPPSGKTSLTKQTGLRVKPPTSVKSGSSTTTAPVFSKQRSLPAKSGLSKKPQTTTNPSEKDTKRPVKASGLAKPVRIEAKSSSVIPKPKVGPVKSSIVKEGGGGVGSTSHRLHSSPPSRIAPRRRTIATTTPSKINSSISDSPPSSSATSTPLVSRSDTTLVSDFDNVGATHSGKKKRRSLIPTPTANRDSAPLSKVLAPIPINMDDGDTSRSKMIKKPSLAGPKVRKPLVVPPARGTKSLLQAPRSLKGRSVSTKLDKQTTPTSTSGFIPDYDPEFEYQLLKRQRENVRPKVMHSPIDKENRPATPHSEWSPIKRTVVIAGEECFQCTKYSRVRQ